MDIKWLKTFITAASTENFHETAEKLYIAQPTVTVHIKQLENVVGASLFEKRGRNIFLTTAGKRFYPYARNILESFETGIGDIEAWRQGYDQKITLAVSPLIAASILPNLIRIFMKKHPTIEIAINVVESAIIGETVRAGKADLGLSRMSHDTGVSSFKLYDDPVRLIVPHDGGDAETALPIDFEKIIHEHMVFSHNHPVYWDELLLYIKQRFPRVRSMVVSQVNVTKRFIEEGLGISFLPHSTVTREILEGRVLEVDTDGFELPIAATYVVTNNPSEETGLFQKYLQDYYSLA
ncbi:LysR family transcriptional regulator [Fredinandcohnia sp. 179-A 10B2 NHS]|uniref:LysR family transcriptional regulator n=1 Tax=Fredinandcohnia sp. 179-A 10B2 NHS TaxID=3235176 RepID=UPI0039A12B40